MQNTRNVTADLYYVGADDRKITLFENTYPTPYGMSYNSYVLIDEKCVIFDTIDASLVSIYLENIEAALDGKQPSYLIVSHMEPDHSATIKNLVERYPDMQLVCNTKSLAMLKNFFTFDVASRVLLVNDGDTLICGKHTLKFIFAPMVHWPEVMLTLDISDKILFTADAFGAYGALNGNLYADEVDLNEYFSEMRRYYSNIVGKYGAQVTSALKKLAALDFKLICPLHGLIWRDKMEAMSQESEYLSTCIHSNIAETNNNADSISANICTDNNDTINYVNNKNISCNIDGNSTNSSNKSYLNAVISKYQRWAAYEAEENSVTIVYGSVYGNTANAAEILATFLADKGVLNIKIFDAATIHSSYIISDVFRSKYIVLASATTNNEIFAPMENLIRELSAHGIKNRNIAIIQNGSWAPTAGAKIRELVSMWKDTKISDKLITILSTVKSETVLQLKALACEIAESLL